MPWSRKPKSGGQAAAGAMPKRGAAEASVLSWCRDLVARVSALEDGMRALGDAELADVTATLRASYQAGAPLDTLAPEAFAVVREAAVRTLGQRPHDEQVMGAAVLHLGKVAEMRTGEGKTLTATLPAYLHALAGDGVHVMTANSYLAERDAQGMGPVYRFLGMEARLLPRGRVSQKNDEVLAAKQAAYAADITYGDFEEFCYDYLRDQLALSLDERAQRGRCFALVDEADLIMIDQARNLPQIMTGADQPELPFAELAAIAADLRPDIDYARHDSGMEVLLTDVGAQVAEDRLGITSLYDEANLALAHGMQKALEAEVLRERDRDYIVTEGRVLWLDKVSGRASPSSPGDGLGQAIEAKEGIDPHKPMHPLSAIATNESLKRYQALAAMTGIAAADSASYQAIYGLNVVVIPTHRPVIRVDHPGEIYGTAAAKLGALTESAARRHARGQPVLIGAASITQAEQISALLAGRQIPHEVLTAKNDDREAELIAAAGRLGAVTVIAQMAGRGVDIRLGGPQASQAERDDIADLGGLCVLGAERSFSRRAEALLRGRAGRQGDPGESWLYASFEDETLIRGLGASNAQRSGKIYASGGPAQSKFLNTQLDKLQDRAARVAAQQVTELLEYDAVLAAQRREFYAAREQLLTSDDLSG